MRSQGYISHQLLPQTIPPKLKKEKRRGLNVISIAINGTHETMKWKTFDTYFAADVNKELIAHIKQLPKVRV